MKRYLQFAWRHPYLLAALVVVLFLPWVWMSFLVPPWAIAISLALVPLAALVALALVVRDVNAEEEQVGSGSDEPFLKWRKRTRLFQQVVVGLDTMLERWDTASQTNRKKLGAVTESVEEVIKLTENAVNEISKNFRVVVAKAHEQTEAAMSLLKGDGQRGRHPVAPRIHQGLRHAARERDLPHDELLAGRRRDGEPPEARDRARQGDGRHHRRAAQHGLPDLAHRPRRLGRDDLADAQPARLRRDDRPHPRHQRQAHELTRKTRQGLDAIGDEVRQGNKRTTQVAEAARRAVEVARAEIDTLNAATIEQTRQIEITLQRINDLSVEIQKDINQIIIAMQFQDITRQKLERLHKPTLGAAAESLSLLSHETQALLQRDLYRAVRAYSQSAIKHARASARATEGAGRLEAVTEPHGGGGDRRGFPAGEESRDLLMKAACSKRVCKEHHEVDLCSGAWR